MRARLAGATAVLHLLSSAALSAVGLDVHPCIKARAYEGLPPEHKPF